MLFTPLPLSNCHTFSDPIPLKRDVLYGRPLILCDREITILHFLELFTNGNFALQKIELTIENGRVEAC